jgi:hypothetical protein
VSQPVTYRPPIVGIVCIDDDDEGDDWQVAARYFGARLSHLRFPTVANVAVESPSDSGGPAPSRPPG